MIVVYISLTAILPLGIDGVNDNDRANEEMSAKPAAAAATASKSKAAAAKKTTGEPEVEFLVPARKVPKLYGFGTEDVFAVSYDTKGRRTTASSPSTSPALSRRTASAPPSRRTATPSHGAVRPMPSSS